MIDPSTADVTARVLEMVARCKLEGFDRDRFERGLDYLLAEQEEDGAWFGRWGVSDIYGTSGALAALGPARAESRIDHAIVRGAVWLPSVQNSDGGWGETTDSYKDPLPGGQGPSTASQTAWALIGFLEAVQRLPVLAPEFARASRTRRRLSRVAACRRCFALFAHNSRSSNLAAQRRISRVLPTEVRPLIYA